MDAIPFHHPFSDEADQFFFVPTPTGSKEASEEPEGYAEFIRHLDRCWPHEARKKKRTSAGRWWDNGASLDCTLIGKNAAGAEVRGRALICPCEAGAFFSVACRLTVDTNAVPPPQREPEKGTILSWAPSPSTFEGPLSIETLAKKLCDCLHPKEIKEGGVIVIAGATSAGKSQLAEAMLYYSLVGFRHLDTPLIPQGHVLTVESPFGKKHLVKRKREPSIPGDDPKWDPLPLGSLPEWGGRVCATRRLLPRTGPRDARDLQQVLEIDARRQHPKAVYVDEIREDRDWKYLIDFGLTRHLVITTTHASTLPETLARISRALNCRKPDERARIGRALLAVIHLDAFEIEDPPTGRKGKFNAILPAVWTRGKATTAGLAWPGISSVVPHCPLREDETRREVAPANEAGCCLGRSYFATSLIPELGKGLEIELKDAKRARRERKKIQQKARERDLMGY